MIILNLKIEVFGFKYIGFRKILKNFDHRWLMGAG